MFIFGFKTWINVYSMLHVCYSGLWKLLWNDLLSLRASVGEFLWVVSVDFNARLSIDDRQRGAAFGNNPCKLFRS